MSKEECSRLPPVPEDPAVGVVDDDRRLWIGNLDTRVTEYSLLKLLQKFGTLERFDFLYHKSGPEEGKSRGYCFVSYKSRQEAEFAMKHLNGKLALSKRMVVRWAHKDEERVDKPKAENPSVSLSCCQSAESKIEAIEKKLKTLEKAGDDFDLSAKPAAPPGSSKLSKAQNSVSDQSKPYSRKYPKR